MTLKDYLLTVILTDAFLGGEWKRDRYYSFIWDLKYRICSSVRRYLKHTSSESLWISLWSPYIDEEGRRLVRMCKETDSAAYIAELGRLLDEGPD